MGSMRFLLILAVMMAVYSQTSQALRILGIFPLAIKSHFISSAQLMRELARRGHQVDVVSHFPLKKPIPNYKDISLEGSGFHRTNNVTYEKAKILRQFSIKDKVQTGGIEPCDFLSQETFQKLLKVPKNTYDVVVVEVYMAHCYLAFAQHFDVPLVGVVASKMHDWLYGHFGIPFNTAYIPGIISRFSQNMTFLERLQNTFLSSMIIPLLNYYVDAECEHVEKYFGRKLSSITELFNDISVLLVNSHHSLNDIIPTTPGVIEVGGLHVHDNQQQLSPELKNWLDKSKHGCVYFSFGSMIRIETFPPEILKAFYEMFERIAPVRVLMKIVDVEILPPGLPKNVKTSPWLPQVAVLKHENIKLFITHGGLLGTQESVAHAVPMVGIPFFADQHTNIETYEKKKIAVSVKLEDITADSLTNAVNTVLKDPTYRDNIKKISEMFHDRPMSALDTGVYWVEYAARHGNVLQSPATKLTWWQYYLIDVYGFVLLCLLIVLYTIKQCFKLLRRLVCSQKTGHTKSPTVSKSKKTK